MYLLLGKESTSASKCLHARRKDVRKKIPLCYVCCLFSQRPGANIQSLKEYKRSRQRQAASAPIANTLVPQAITDTKLDDVIIQVMLYHRYTILTNEVPLFQVYNLLVHLV